MKIPLPISLKELQFQRNLSGVGLVITFNRTESLFQLLNMLVNCGLYCLVGLVEQLLFSGQKFIP